MDTSRKLSCLFTFIYVVFVILSEARTIAIKETIAWQVQQAMLKGNIIKVEMAKRMHTSRAALDRLLDPGNGAVTLQTLSRAANAIGRGLRIELV